MILNKFPKWDGMWPEDTVLVRQMLIPVVRKRSLRWKYFTLVCFRASHSVRSLPGAAPNCISSDSRHSTSLKRLAPKGAAFFGRYSGRLRIASWSCAASWDGASPLSTGFRVRDPRGTRRRLRRGMVRRNDSARYRRLLRNQLLEF